MVHTVVTCHTQSLCQIIVAQQKKCVLSFALTPQILERPAFLVEKKKLSFYSVGDQIGYNDVLTDRHKRAQKHIC